MSGHERERLSAYLDGELSAEERAEVAAHLAACPECAALLAAFAAVDGEASSLPAEAPDGYFESFPRRVAARLAAGQPAAAGPRRMPAWAWAAAAALLLAVVTPLTLRRAPTVAPTPVPEAPAARRAASPEASPPPAAPEPATPAPVPAPAAPRKAAPPAILPAPAGPTAPAEARPKLEAREEAEADFVRAPLAAAPAPVPGTARAQEGGAPAVTAESALSAADRRHRELDLGVEGGVPGGVVGGVVGDVGGGTAARTPEEWRRLRDEWKAFAASVPAGPRADEARVRAIEAGWEAWRLSGRDDDEAAFRRDARAYLEREDALQKPRVERLLARPEP